MNTTSEPPIPPAAAGPPAGSSDVDPRRLKSDIDTIRGVLESGDRDNDLHRLILAGANLFCGLLMSVAVPVMLLVIGIVGIATPPTPEGEPSPTLIVGTVGLFVIAIVVLLSIPFFLAGWGLLRRKSWAPVAAVVAAILNLANFPIGTAIAVYTFWAASQGRLSSRLPSAGGA